MFTEINSKVKEGCILGDKSEFPLGSIVFFYVAKNAYIQGGITHVGIVVDYKKGSPVIAHAANESATNNRPAIHWAVMSRLREKDKNELLHYIVIKPHLPEHHLKQIVELAQSLCTSTVNESPIIKYSDERSKKTIAVTNHFYETYKEGSLKRNFHTVLKNHLRYTSDCYAEVDEAHGLTRKGRGLYAPMAKMFNYMNTGLGDKLSGVFEKFKRKSKPQKYLLALDDLTHKGWHCVQFVVMVYQMAFLLIEDQLEGLYDYNSLKGIKNTQYFAKKEGSGNDMERLHPKKAILQGKVASFVSVLTSSVFTIPLESKLLSPAALLYYLVGRDFPSPAGGHWRAHVGDSGIYALGDLSLSADTLERSVDDPQASRQVRLNRLQLRQNLLELRLIQWVTVSQLMQRISVPRSIVVRRPKRGPDHGSSGSRKVARL